MITAGGYREPINLQQIRSNLEMESHEERLHNMIKQSKVESAKDQARAAESTIRSARRDSGMVGIGGGQGGMPDFGGPESSFHQDVSVPTFTPSAVTPPVAPQQRAPAVKGMSLMSAGGKNKSLEDALYKEDKLTQVVASTVPVGAGEVAPQPIIQHPVMIQLSEKVSCRTTRDGTVENFTIQGSLTLTASDEDAAKCCVQLSGNKSDIFSYKTRPEINKGVYESQNLLQLKDANKGFPSGRPTGILKWTHASTNEDIVPIKINCWPEEEARGQMIVSIEYSVEQNIVLHDVRIRIPLGTAEMPKINSIDGTHKHFPREGELVWEVDLIDSNNNNGSLEFTVAQRDADAFFPITVDFSSPQLFSGVEVGSVLNSEQNAAIQYGMSKGLTAGEYTIV